MMDIVVDAVKRIQDLSEHGGCADAGVVLDVNPNAKICQFEQGAPMSATFGGRSAVFTTFDPIRAPTKIAFMFGAPLDSVAVRGAAVAIINVILGFLCMSRVLHPCRESSHAACHDEIRRELAGKSLYCIGAMGKSGPSAFGHVTQNLSDADVIIINGEGLVAQDTGDLIEANRQRCRVICIGPSTAGIARLYELEHWCPYGRNCQD
ncbi:hypothetical protein [Methanoregula formicica]|uniref:Uncharacterized protein n=1 Tax=Methanoregula formicica (strain DSM 22288 / NBRC 105244 / SMSP) TaxID=593750 RepID=L0HII5_METFS|nr:hypothetical protein [Methanoregula formicica]AGB03840.1 hypothetical protein Metfor_2857 [Methanoregula formicica SMSP]